MVVAMSAAICAADDPAGVVADVRNRLQQAAESTAAVLTFVDAMQRCQCFEPEKVRDAIAATNMMTFYGPIKFDETGKNIAKPMVLYQIQKGHYRVVAPVKWAEAKFIYPRKVPK